MDRNFVSAFIPKNLFRNLILVALILILLGVGIGFGISHFFIG